MLTSFFKAKSVNKIYTYVAPKIIGGKGELSPLKELDIAKMSEALLLDVHETKTIATDQLIISYPTWSQ